MCLIFEKNSNLRPMVFTGITIIFFSLFSNSAKAEGSWWYIGGELLNTFTENDNQVEDLTSGEIGGAFKDALQIGTENVVGRLGQVDGFNADSTIHIPLPEKLEKIKSVLSKIGMSGLLDDLELKLNRAAEAATPKAKKLFGQSITEMTFDDVMTVYKGPEDAATKYFQKKMSPSLAKEMTPVIEESLSSVGAIESYDNVMGQYRSIPFVPDVKANLTEYVTNRGMDGIFHYIAQEEIAIRRDPAKQTTDLLKRVFGSK